MKLHIITVGEPKLPYARAGFTMYYDRLRHHHKIRLTHVPDKQNDAQHISAAIGSGFSVALVIDGPQMSSEQLTAFIEQRNQDGREVAFVIGGPEGLPSEVIAASQAQLSFSRLTFPHDLAMVILVEALYRASTIAAGQPYHK